MLILDRYRNSNIVVYQDWDVFYHVTNSDPEDYSSQPIYHAAAGTVEHDWDMEGAERARQEFIAECRARHIHLTWEPDE